MDRATGTPAIPIGADVVALNGQRLGKVHIVHPHYLVVEQIAGEGTTDYEVPMHAVVGLDAGRVQLSVNLEALNALPAEQQSAAHRRHDEG